MIGADSLTEFEDVKLIRDLKSALKDFEPQVKNPAFLLRGRDYSNFRLRPREAWANWLLAVVLSYARQESITFGDHPDTDGILVNSVTGDVVPVEHVSALENEFNQQSSGEERIINAINLKIDKGDDYAEGKILVAFFDGAGEFYRNKIREAIKTRHNFIAVYCVGLLTSDQTGYSYLVTEFRESYDDQSITFKVDINEDFTNWEVEQIME